LFANNAFGSAIGDLVSVYKGSGGGAGVYERTGYTDPYGVGYFQDGTWTKQP
jgi:hypothetical protein